jgi:hypothetical protein
MEKYVALFEAFGKTPKLKEAKPKDNSVILDNNNAEIILIDSDDKYKQINQMVTNNLIAIKSTGVVNQRIQFDKLYYEKLVTPYYVSLKNNYFAKIPVICMIDYKNHTIEGRFKKPANSSNISAYTEYFNKVINWGDPLVVFKNNDITINIEAINVFGGNRWDFTGAIPNDIEMPLDAQDIEMIHGEIIDLSSNNLFVWVFQDGSMNYMTPMLYDRADPNLGNKEFVFDYNVNSLIK